VNLSIIPSVVGTVNHKYDGDNKPSFGYNIGADVKYAVTSSLNLDLTVLPDFSNVNVDRQVTNLERFSLFFPEQRQFFIENSDLFSSFGFSQIRPFFSRKIGLAKNKNGDNTSIGIPFGARLSGNATQDLRVGVMSIQTAQNSELGIETQNYTVAAAQYRVLERSNIGAIFVNRQGKNFEGIAGNDYNRTIGADFNYASGDGTWQGKLFYHQNFTPQNKPDQYATAGWLRYSTPSIEVNWNHELIGAGYSPEVGFVPRNGVFRLQPTFGMTFFPEDRSVVNQHGFGSEGNAYWSIQPFQYDPQTRFKLLDRSAFSWYYVSFANTAEISGFVGNIFTYLYDPFDPTGRGEDSNKLPVAGYDTWRTGMDFNTDRRQALSFRGFVRGGQYFNGNSVRYGGNINWRVQPFGSISIDVQRDDISLPQPYKSAGFTLIGAQLDFTPTRDIFFTTFLQYNAQINNVNVNSRLQWRFAPMSDLFIVYTDNYEAQFWKIKNRGLAVKLTYWFNA
jgi:Domain of unknown function (DUF5916)